MSKLVMVACSITLLIVTIDWFFDILPGNVQHRLPKVINYHASHPARIISDIKIEVCFTESGCRDKETETWKMVPKDLKYGASSWSTLAKTYLFSNSSETDVDDERVVVDIVCNKTLLQERIRDKHHEGKSLSEISDDDIRSGGWELVDDTNLWMLKDTFDSKKERIMGIDVLFGTDAVDARAGWSLVQGNIIDLKNTEIVPRLSVLRAREHPVLAETQRATIKDELRVNSNGKFKVLQIADLHYGSGPGEGQCCDSAGDISHIDHHQCQADSETQRFVESVLDLEKPDMVVLSGDQIYAKESLDQISALYKAVACLESRKIPYALIWGNHDDEGGQLDRGSLSNAASHLDHSLFETGPEDVDGFGNYMVSVKAARSSYPALTFYFADSHGRQNTKSGNPPYKPLSDKQLDYLKRMSSEQKIAQKGYSHIPLAMAFIHVPFMEFRFISNMMGTAREGVACARTGNARDVFQEIGVSIVACGHDHTNDYCGVNSKDDSNAIWLCYGGAVGERGYAGHDYVRRLRVYEFDTQSGSITSWKRTHDSVLERSDEQILVQGGELVYTKI